MRNRCIECGRVFDMADEIDAQEWNYGHDCETITLADCEECGNGHFDNASGEYVACPVIVNGKLVHLRRCVWCGRTNTRRHR